MDLRKELIIPGVIIGVLLVGISFVFLRHDFLLDTFGQCYEHNDACCLKLGVGYFSKCTHVSMACADKDEMPVFSGCDDQCKHIIECVRGVNEESMFGDDNEINKSCSVDSDCKLPFSYAARSSCPYEMRCVDSKCAVICPWDLS